MAHLASEGSRMGHPSYAGCAWPVPSTGRARGTAASPTWRRSRSHHVVVRTVGHLWREVGIAAEESEQEGEQFTQRIDPAVQELETLLQARTGGRPSAPG
jgi:hypothetical protein